MIFKILNWKCNYYYLSEVKPNFYNLKMSIKKSLTFEAKSYSNEAFAEKPKPKILETFNLE